MQVVDLNSNLSRTRFDFSDFQHKKYLSATNVALKLIYFIVYQQFEKLKKMKWTSQEMYRLRNRISHEYFGIDYDILWDIAKNHLPYNHADIISIIEKEGEN